jgi:Zn-dependent alcohol dehydrogenase
MKAAVCYAFGEPLRVEEVTIAPPQAGEVQVRLVATAICHSDVHLIRGEWGGKLPVVAGHEAAGVVEAVGEHVTRYSRGSIRPPSLNIPSSINPRSSRFPQTCRWTGRRYWHAV